MTMNRHKGFTLIEVLIYMAIFVIFIGGMVLIAFAMLTAHQRALSQIEVADNERFLIQKLQRIIQGATSINNVAGSGSSSLSLNTPTPTENPTVISLVNGTVLLQKANLSYAIPLTNSWVQVSNLTFTYTIFSAGTKGTVRVQAHFVNNDAERPIPSDLDTYISLQ